MSLSLFPHLAPVLPYHSAVPLGDPFVVFDLASLASVCLGLLTIF